MQDRWFRHFWPARMFGPAILLLTAIALARPVVAATPLGTQAGDHTAALAALADVKAALAMLVTADRSYATDRTIYYRASQRAINALEGLNGPDAVAGLGSPGDADGAIGHIDALLDRKATPVWVDPLHGAEANLRAAVSHLHDSLKARELMDYQIAVSRALAYLEVAQGRPTETGVLGGLEGALANTTLGIPDGATQEDACAPPRSAPAYGTHDGNIAWVTVPISAGAHTLAENPGGTEITVQGDMIVLRTAAAPLVARTCSGQPDTAPTTQHAAAAQVPLQEPAQPQQVAQPRQTEPKRTEQLAALQQQQGTADSAGGGAPPALYTLAQAREGAIVYGPKCAGCHGANMQGTAAPSVAGNDFLNTASRNGWTLAVIRYLVFNIMPMNAPHSLSPNSYAAVMAYLLASNCYPAGNTPFPTEDQPSFAAIKLAPVPGTKAEQNSRGVCQIP
jgi:polar amino acid transport system substrate-binding protein